MPQKHTFPHRLCVPDGADAGMVYPFGRWSGGFVVANLQREAAQAQRLIRTRLGPAAACLFVLLFVATTVLSTRLWGGPHISLQMRPLASTSIVSLPAACYFLGRRLIVWRAVRRNPKAAAIGRLFVWANIDNGFGAATRHPSGAWLVAPWLDAGRTYRIDGLSGSAAQRLVRGCILFELALVLCVCLALITLWHQPVTCIYGISLYYWVSQPIWTSMQLHVLLPRAAPRWHAPGFDMDEVMANRYRWLRIFVASGLYMAVLLLTCGRQSLRDKHHAPMQTYLFLAAYATALCYTVLAHACLIKTWNRPWSRGSLYKSILARSIFAVAVLFLAASIFETYRVAPVARFAP